MMMDFDIEPNAYSEYTNNYANVLNMYLTSIHYLPAYASYHNEITGISFRFKFPSEVKDVRIDIGKY
jgi:hypothetical protein